MGGKYYKGFYSGGYLYQVREYQSQDYGRLFKIWRIDEEFDDAEPELVYTIYRKASIDYFIQNIYDANWEYDMNL